MYYFIKDIARIINGTVLGKGNPDAIIRHLIIDTRSIASAETSLFFALKGERNDGHKFLSDAFKKRIRNFVVSELPETISEYAGCNFVLVKDTLSALQFL